jgi:hypothetical protein
MQEQEEREKRIITDDKYEPDLPSPGGRGLARPNGRLPG